MPVFCKTKKGAVVIQLGQNRLYRRSDSKGPKAIWYCGKKNFGCRATAWTIDEEIVKLNNDHNHD